MLLTSGPQLISIIPNDGSLLLPNATVHTAPTQLTFRFLLGAGEAIDPNTLGGIELTRSGGDGAFAGGNDVHIAPGFVGIDPAHLNQVVMRFDSPLPDDLYRITIVGGSAVGGGAREANPLTDTATPALPFNGGADYNQDFRLQLGPQVLSVVPQPVTRDSAGALVSNSKEIDVYFNEPVQTLPGQPTHLDPGQFQLIATQNSATTADDVVNIPTAVQYNPTNNEARLMFSSDIASLGLPGTSTVFRLRIGNTDLPLPTPTVPTGYPGDPAGTFAGADPIGALGSQTQIYNGNLVTQPIDPNLVFPGGIDDPGHRDIPLSGENHATGFGGASLVTYSFPDIYGNDPTSGQPLHNQITANQKQTVREIFQLYAYYTGLTFVEVPSGGEDQIVTGDTRVLNPIIPPSQLGGIATLGLGMAIINGNLAWGSSLYGSGYMSVAMHEIGHTLGLPHDDDGPPGTIMNGGAESQAPSGPAPPPLFPGLADVTNLLYGNEPNSNQIDLYQFTATSTGTLNAQTKAQQTGASNLDTLLTLYEEFNDLNLPASGAQVNNGDTFTIQDNVHPAVTFEFTNNGPSINPSTGKLPDGNVGVLFSATSSQQDLAAAIVSAVGKQGLNVAATVGLNDVELAGPITVSVAGASVSLSQSRKLIARNDDFYGKDSFVNLNLNPGIYYVAVTSTGNDQFNPVVPNSGWGGKTFGTYELLLNFQPSSLAPLTDPGMSLFTPANPISGAGSIPDKYSVTLTDLNAVTGLPVTETLKFYNGSSPVSPPPSEVSIQLLPADTQDVVANKIIAAMQTAISSGGFNAANYVLSNLGGGRIEVGGGAATKIAVDPSGKGALTGTPLVLWGDAQRDALVGNSNSAGAGAYDFWFNVGATLYVDKTAPAGGTGAVTSPYNTIQAALQNTAVTQTAVNSGQQVNVRVEGNANDTLAIAVNQNLGQPGRIQQNQTFKISAGPFTGVFEFTNSLASIDAAGKLPDGNFGVWIPGSDTAADIALSLQNALNAAVVQLPAGGQVALAQAKGAALIAGGQVAADGGVTVSFNGASDGNYYYVKLFQGQSPLTVDKQTTPFNPLLTGVLQPALFNNSAYLVGADQFGNLLPDNSPGNSMLQLPKNVVLMVDAGAAFKLRKANIAAGSSVVNVDDSQSALQVLGIPGEQATFTSYFDDTPALGAPQVHPGLTVAPGDWGGLVFNNDSDLETLGLFLNSVAEAKLNYGGGQVVVNGVPQAFAPIYLDTSRPAVTNNLIINSASAAISGNPNAFESTRFGSDRTMTINGIPVDGNQFTVGGGGTTFEFDSNGIVSQGHIALSLTGLTTQAKVATAIAAAINKSLLANSVDKAQAIGNVVTLPTNLPFVNGGSPLASAVDSFSLDYQRFGPDVYGNTLSQSLGYKLSTVAGGGITSGTKFVVNNQGFQLLSSGAPQAGYIGVGFTATSTASAIAQSIAAAINAANLGVAAQWTAGQSNLQILGAFYLQAPAPLAATQSFAQNTTNGLFIRINTNAGQTLDTLDVPAEFASTDIPYVLQENLVIHDDLGFTTAGGAITQRVAGQLTIDPGAVLKLASSRIEAGMGSNVIAEGTAAQPIVFTSLNDARYGGGGTFDTADNGGGIAPQAGDWGGLYFWPTSRGSIDHALITFGGGATAVEGGFAPFDAVEIHQAKVRIADSTLENNASGAAGGADRVGREGNDAATIYVLGSQPAVLNNVIQNNAGAAISIDVDSLTSNLVPDWGRSTGTIDRFSQFDDNYGALVRLNKIGGNNINGMLVRGGTLETSSIWDDTDIVHVLEDNVLVPDFASVGGLRLQSSATQSLVVKLQGATAGFTASGDSLDVSNRIGGSVQILGTPQHPVVLTSLKDATAGAGLTPDDQPDNNTDNSASQQSGLLPTVPEINRGTTIDNDVDPNVVGHFEANIGVGGDLGGHDPAFFATPSAPNPIGVTAQGQLSKLLNANFVYDYGNYVQVGSGTAKRLSATTITEQPTLISPEVVESKGSFAGANGTVNWTVTSKFQPGTQQLVNTISLNSSQAIGALRFINYLDEDVPPNPQDDILFTQGTPGQPGFQAFTIDGPQRVGVSQGGVYVPGPGLANASYAGWAADTFDNLQQKIAAGTQTFSVPGVINTVNDPQFNDPTLGKAYGLADQTTAFAWDVSPTATSSTITTFLGEVATAPSLAGGQWNSVKLDQYSNDRNVATVNETEPALTGGKGTNDTTAAPQSLGQLAPNLQSGDDNSRLGFQVNGYISPDYSQDVDTYTFKATAGTQTWLDLTNTAASLDAVLELVDAQGNVLARSDDSGAEQRDATAAGDPLFAGPLLRSELPNNLALPLQSSTFGTSGMNFWSTNPRDPGFRVVLPGTPGVHDYYVRVYSKNTNAPGLPSLAQFTPGQGTSSGQYQLQIRLQEQVEVPGSMVQYADIRYATNGIDVEGLPGHSPLVSNSSSQSAPHNTLPTAQDLGDLLTSDTSSINAGGNLTDPAGTSVDWYKFELTYAEIQVVTQAGKTWATVFDLGYADGLTRPDTVMDVYDSLGNLIFTGRDSNVADQQPRPNAGQDASELNHSSFGTLDPFIGTVQMPAGQPNSGKYTYYVAIHSNGTLPQALDGTFNAGSINSMVRLEPVDSVSRVVEDHVGSQGGQTGQDPSTLTPLWGTQANQTVATLNSYATPFNLSDVVLFGNTGGNNGHLLTFNPFTGVQETDQGQFNGNDQGGFNDIAMRNDGELYGLTLGAPGNVTDGTSGNLIQIDTGTPANDVFRQDDGVVTYKPDPASTTGGLTGANVGVQYDAMAFNPINSNAALQKTPPDFWAIGHRQGDRPDSGNSIHDPNWPFGYNAFTNLLYHFRWDTNSGQYLPVNFSNNPPVPYTNPRNAGTGFAPAGDPLYPGSTIVTGLFDPSNELITGLAMIGAGGTMFAVSNEGNLYTLNTALGAFTLVAKEGAMAFNSLSGGPTHVENGAYANTLFATDTAGNLHAYNASGAAQPIFVGGATSVSLGGGVQGIAFSTLDYNLWHVTDHRGADPAATPADQGHGIVAAPDNSRTKKTPNPPKPGGESFYFGLENPASPDVLGAQPGAGNYATNPTIAANWVAGSSNYTPNYNLPGGAYGSLSTNTFSLANYSSTDKPTLYFDYFLNTEDAESSKAKLQQMFDSARVMISQNGGISWQPLATNNYYTANFNDPKAERPYYQSTSSETGSGDPLQRVQPLFDSNATSSLANNTGWRQGRVDLGDFAGQNNLQLRFDFSTAGTTFNPGDLTVNAVTGKANNPYSQVTPGDQFGQFQGGNNNGNGPEHRGLNNSHEGWYIDDITIGLAERGEMITNPNAVKSSGSADTSYANLQADPFKPLNGFNSPTMNPDPAAVQQLLSGPYQLEIRRGTEYGFNFNDQLPDIALAGTFNSNDRLSQSYSMIAPPGGGLSDGETFTLSDGVNSVTFEFDDNGSVAVGNAPIAFLPSFIAQQVADAIVTAVNGNPTLVNVSAADVINPGDPNVPASGAQGVSDPLTNIVNFFNVKELVQSAATYNRVTVSLASGSVTESSTNNQGTVTRDGDLSQPLTVTLSALDIDNGLAPSGNAAFPGGLTTTTVVIPANQTFANFLYNGVLHLLPGPSEQADGTHTVEITASALNYIGVGARVDVTDDPGVLPTFSVSLNSGTAAENAAAPVQGTVTINTGPVSGLQHPFGLTVSLSSLYPTAALVAASALGPAAAQTTVTIPVGQTQAAFFVFPQDDNISGRQPNLFRDAGIVAAAVGVVSGNATLRVTDDVDGTIPFGVATWTSIGPAPISNGQIAGGHAVSGRITGIAADPLNPNTVYIAAAGGGVWKTTNGGTSWTPLTDNLTDVSGNPIPLFMGAIAVAPNNRNMIYAGTGEANNSGDSAYGRGILVSPDGGLSWTLRTAGGAFDRRTVSKIAVDPTNANIAYAAVGDFAVNGLGGNTGIWKTTDGGVNWTNTTAGPIGDMFDPFSDVAVDPNSPQTVYAAVGHPGGVAKNGVYKSTDGGATWALLSGSGSVNGAQDGRIVLALYHAGATNELFVSIANPASGKLFKMLKSTDGGASFTDLTSNLSNYLGTQGWYDTTLAIDPQNPNYIYAAGDMSSQGPTFSGSPLESFDGGNTWTGIATDAAGNGPHTDAHAVAFDASGNLLDGDDGGIFKLSSPTSAANQRWSSLNTNLSTIQFQAIALDPTDPTVVLGGSQDNGTERYAGSPAWTLTDFGDGGTVRFDPQNANIAYHIFDGGFFMVSNDAGQTWTPANNGLLLSGNQNFYPPFTVAPSNGSEVLVGDNNLWITTNSAGLWSKLTTVGTAGWNPSGNPVDAIAIAPNDSNTIYAATGGAFANTSRIFVSANGGGSWTELDLPAGSGRVNQLAVDPNNSQIAYAVVNVFTGGAGHVFRTANGGASWSDISAGLPDEPTNAIAINGNTGALYVGDDTGVYVSNNLGASWAPLGVGLPHAQVVDLQYNPTFDVLGAATHGRGAFLVTGSTGGTTLTLSLNGAAQVGDDAGLLPGKLTVTRLGTTGNLIVSLTSSNPALASLPATVTILNGQTSANVNVTISDSLLAANPQSALFSATAAGLNNAESIGAVLDVLPDGDPNSPTDNDTPALTLSIPNVTMVPATPSQVLTATVTRNTPTTDALVVSLVSMDPSVVSLPATVTIPAGQSSVTFTITEIDHFVADVEQIVSIVAASSGFASGAGQVTADSIDHVIHYDLAGDATMPRPQGEVILYGNQISNASQNGILVSASVPGAPGDNPPNNSLPHPGGLVNTPTLNGSNLAPGVVIANNLIYGVGQSGIAFLGNNQPAGAPQSVVPFGRIVNNTIYGGDTPTGTGILVNNNASPTILNNVLVNLSSGNAISVQGGSQVVLGENFYQNSGANPTNVGLGSFAQLVVGAGPSPFRGPSTDPSTANFYLTDTALPIDSAINSLQDRAAMTAVTGPLGIPPSPIIAPAFDLYGQFRVDDPNVANSNLGTGQNVFIDRGAIEHADTAGPSAALLAPVDNDQSDLNPATNIVFVRGQSLSEFTIQLNDGSGSGIFDASAADPARVVVREDGRLLSPGIDYTYSYDNNNHVIRLIAMSGVWLNGHQYDLYLDNGVKFDPGNLATTPVGITDRAGNFLQANGPDGLTHFRLLLANLTNSAPVLNLVTSGPAALSMFENDNAALPVAATFSSATAFSAADNKPVTLSIVDVDSNGGSETLVLTATHGVLTLTNAALAELTSLGIDTSTIGNNSNAITITAPLGEASVFGSTPGINAALEGLTFTPDLNFDSHAGDQAVLTVTVNDNGNSPAPAQLAVLTIPITVIAINDPPAETVPPSPISINEDFSVVFSAAGSNPVTVSDTDVPVASADYNNPLLPYEETITLSDPTLGRLQLATVAGLTFLNGTANGQSSLDFQGTLAAINTALDGLTFVSAPRRSGSVVLQFTTNDNGNIGVGPGPGHLASPQPLSATATVTVNIAPQAYSPLLNNTATLSFPPVPEDVPVASNAGSTVLAMLQSDPSFPSTPITLNAPAFELPQDGIAVIGATQTANGVWQFKSPSAPGWTAFPAVSNTSALLLAPGDLVRFLPKPKFDDTRGAKPTLTFIAWDGTYDRFKGGPDAEGLPPVDLTQTGTGGDTPFSDISVPATASLDVLPQPEAPVLGATAALSFSPINEDVPVAGNTGGAVLAMLQSDPLFTPNAITLHATASPKYGIAVVGLGQTSNGVWQYELAGGAWAAFPVVSNTSALLLDGNDLVRFLPNPKFDDTRGGAPTLSFIAWDETFDYVTSRNDAHGTTVNLTSTLTGGSTPFSSGPAVAAVLHVVPQAEAPVLDSTAVLNFNSINEDVAVASNAGGSVLAMLQSAAPTPPNAITLHAAASPKDGIAVVGLGETSQGTWQYQLGAGAWTNFPAVSNTSALLLDGADLVRFLPNPKFDDTRGPAPTLTFIAWDETFDFVNNRIDAHGTTVNLTSTLTGGSTPFSSGPAVSAVLHVVPQPEAPTLNPAAVLAFASIDEDPASNVGSPVLSMLQSDPLVQPNAVTLNAVAAPQFGIAVVGLGQTSKGTWQYELAGGNAWTNFPSVSTASAVLLDGGDLVRFVPSLNFNDFYGGAPTLSFAAWDETFDYVNSRIDAHGSTVDLTSTLRGGSTPFSTGSALAALSVKAVNDPPVVSGPTGPVALNPSFPFSLSTLALPAFTASDVDLPEGNQQMQMTVATTENGVAGGEVDLNQLTGISIVGGANHSSSVTFKGNINDVNAALANLAYEQDMNFNGTAQVTFVANDLGNSGLGPNDQPAPFPLNSAPLVLSLTGVPIHRAPVLGVGSPSFPAVLENVPPANVPPAGSSINSMLASGGANFLTVDAFAGGQTGIAVTATSPAAGGVWQYSSDGVNWTAIANVALNQALLLPASDLVRFWPDPGFAGAASLSFAAWDQVTGTAGSTVDLSGANARGGFSSFSTASGVATLNVKLINQPPIFTLPSNASVLENNTVAASGGAPGGSDAGPISLPFVTGLSPGQPIELQAPFSQTVTFTVATDRPDLFVVQPTLDTVAAGAVDPTRSTLHFTLKPDVFGTAHLTVTAKDNGGTADGGVDTTVAVTTLTVSLINDPPSLNPLSDFNLTESAIPAQQQVALSGIGAGLGESQNLTVTAVSDNLAAVPNPTIVYASPNATGQLTFTPNPYGSGVAHITVTVKDDGGTANGGVDTFTQTFTVNLQFFNDAPSFTKGPDVAVNEDAPLTMIPGWATNVSPGRGNGDVGQALNFIVAPSDPTVFATPPTIDPATGNLQFRFIPNFNGFSNVTVKLHDNGGTANGGVDTSAIQTFRLTSNFINDAPSFTAGPDQTVNENAAAQTVANWATGISPGPGFNESGQTLTFTATNTNPSLFAVAPSVNPATGALTYTPALNASGLADVTLTLHDNGGTANGGVDSFSQTFRITVNFVNHAPSFVSGGDQVVNENAPLQAVPWATQISAGPSNESSEALNFIVTTDNGALFLVPPTIDPNGVLAYQPAAYASGVANVTVKLHDDGGTANGGADTSAVQTFKVTVNFVNQPPSFTLGPNQVVNEDAPPQVATNFAKNISPGPGANEAGEALDFIISTDNAALFSAPPTIDGATGTLRYTLAPHASGQANVTVQLHDNGGTAFGGINTSPPQAFTITANFVNHAPTFVLQSGDQVVEENAGPQSVSGIATQASPGPGAAEAGQTLNYITTNSNNALFSVQPSIDLTGRLTFTPAPQMFGVAIVSVALHDNGGTANGGSDTSATQTFRIVLDAPPTANADLYDISYASTSSSTVATGVLSNDVDPDGDPLTAILVSGTTHGALTLRPDGSFSYSPNPDFQGVDQFTYKASDGRSESGVVTVGILGHDDGSNIRKLYEQVLHRDPDPAGLAYWTNRIHNGATLADVGASIFESNERLDPILTSYYEQFLLRAPDSQGLAYWRDQVWKVVGGPEPVIAGMISSPEFFRSAGGTDSAWVSALYQRLLNRTADAAGLQYWDNLLETHSMTEFQVVEGFLSSDEYFTNLIDGFFETYLDRMPTAAELANDLAQMHGGASQRDIQFEIVDTDEYRNTPPPPALGTVKRLA